MPDVIRANSVEILKLFRAWCRVGDCMWIGHDQGTYQEANEERQAHLDWHREQQP